MEWFIAVVVVAILGVAAVAAAGGMGEMTRDPVRDTFRQDLPSDRALGAADLQALRFGITLRGYSMAQVDDLLDRLTTEIAERDATIAQLSAAASSSDQPQHDSARHDGGQEPR
ncbi:MAG TPA: DivIVA domain-containing protein [Propionibacteriaceae bacterium]|jgi:DivIVA domain-containing protein